MIRKFSVLLAFVLFLCFPICAQIGTLGIHGCPPALYRENVRFVKLDFNEVDGVHNYILPVNGLRNFNFFYTPDGTGFLPKGGYTLTYLAANQSTVLGYETVTHTPNSGNTLGTEVRPFNIPQGYETTPRGLHGIVLGNIGGTTVPLQNAQIIGFPNGGPNVQTRTNGNGYFSIYYQNGTSGTFLSPYSINWAIQISGTVNGCSYFRTIPVGDIAPWAPSNTGYPAEPSYYVSAAEVVVDVPVITISCND